MVGAVTLQLLGHTAPHVWVTPPVEKEKPFRASRRWNPGEGLRGSFRMDVRMQNELFNHAVTDLRGLLLRPGSGSH